MDNRKIIKGFCVVVFILMLGTLGAALFYNSAFMSSFLLMSSLFLFGVCYYIKDNSKIIVYVLFIIGILLIICSLIYTYLRLS